MTEMTNEQYLNFIMDLVDDGFKAVNDDIETAGENKVNHAIGMSSLALRNIVFYLRRLQGSAKT